MWKKYSVLMFNNKTWVITLQYMIISCIILSIVILFDTGTIYLDQYIPDILLTKVGLATTILSALAGALLSMTVFTFSTIMTIVSFYSSNYTASTIDDFVKSDIVLKVLGIFIGGFFYAVTALLFMRETYDHCRFCWRRICACMCRLFRALRPTNFIWCAKYKFN